MTRQQTSLVENVREVIRDLRPRRLVVTIASGTVAGFVAVAVTISFAALIFSGELEPYLPFGIGLALFGTMVIGLITALGSQLPGAVAGAQDNVAAILAVAVAAVVMRVESDALIATAVGAIVLATCGMGVILFVMGRLRVGGLVRYMPFPVVGGFLAATGVLLVQGGFSILRPGAPAGSLFGFDSLLLWVPGMVIGVGMYASGRYRPGTLLTPLVLLGSAVVLRLGFVVGGVGGDAAMARGWLFGPFPGGVSWSPRTLWLVADANWSAIGAEWIPLVSIGLVAAISLLLYVHALEHEMSTEVDVDGELRVAGFGGVVAGLGGGFPGFLFFSDSALLHRIAGPRRGGAVVAALVNAGVLVFGGAILGLVPRAVIGGVIVGIGLAFVIEWLWDVRRTLGAVDHALVAVIAATTVVVGFLPAIGVGVLIAIGLFVVRYSRIDVVRREFSLDRTSSTLDRDRQHREALREHGGHTLVIEVRGFLFFGTATALFDERRLLHASGQPLRHAVFDLAGVSGADSSLAMAFPRLDRAAARLGVTLVVCGIPGRLVGWLEPIFTAGAARVVVLEDLDSALRWCEDEVLDAVLGGHEQPDRIDLAAMLTERLGGAEAAAAILHQTRRVEVPVGERVITAGDQPAGLYMLEAGWLRVVLERADGTEVLLRRLAPGATLGEVGLYRGEPSSANVIADTPCILRVLTVTAIETLDRSDPAAAAAVHRLSAAVLADRVLHAERAIRSAT